MSTKPALELQRARVAFINWLQERLQFLPWSYTAKEIIKMNRGTFCSVMRGKRSLPRQAWDAMVAPDSYFTKRWTAEQVKEGFQLWQATHPTKRATKKAVSDPRAKLIAQLDELRTMWLDSENAHNVGYKILELRQAIIDL